MLFSLHTMAAAAFSVPELILAPEEAKAMGEAAAAVAAYYDPSLDPKWVAWGNLFLVAGGIYGSRVIAFGLRKKDENKKAGPVVAEFPGAAKRPVNGAPGPAAPRTPADMFGTDYSFANTAAND